MGEQNASVAGGVNMRLLTGLFDELSLCGTAIPVVGIAYPVHIEVRNLNVSLAFEDRERGGTYHASTDDELAQFGLQHEDLTRAVEAQGAFGMSGWYTISLEIAEKMNATPDVEERASRFCNPVTALDASRVARD